MPQEAYAATAGVGVCMLQAFGEGLVVAHAAPYARVGAQAGQHVERGVERVALLRDDIAGDDGDMRPGFVGHRDGGFELSRRQERPGVDVRELHDPQAFQVRLQPGDRDRDLADLEALAADEGSVAGDGQRRGDGGGSGGLQQTPALGRRRVGRNGAGSALELQQQSRRKHQGVADEHAGRPYIGDQPPKARLTAERDRKDIPRQQQDAGGARRGSCDPGRPPHPGGSQATPEPDEEVHVRGQQEQTHGLRRQLERNGDLSFHAGQVVRGSGAPQTLIVAGGVVEWPPAKPLRRRPSLVSSADGARSVQATDASAAPKSKHVDVQACKLPVRPYFDYHRNRARRSDPPDPCDRQGGPRRARGPLTMLEIFDPAMCCNTGVCGPEVDPALVRLASDLEWLKSKGVRVRRFNLAQEPAAFVENPAVRRIVAETEGDGLPVALFNGVVVSQGSYPTRAELARLAGIEASEAAAADRGDQADQGDRGDQGDQGDQAAEQPASGGLVTIGWATPPSTGRTTG